MIHTNGGLKLFIIGLLGLQVLIIWWFDNVKINFRTLTRYYLWYVIYLTGYFLMPFLAQLWGAAKPRSHGLLCQWWFCPGGLQYYQCSPWSPWLISPFLSSPWFVSPFLSSSWLRSSFVSSSWCSSKSVVVELRVLWLLCHDVTFSKA